MKDLNILDSSVRRTKNETYPQDIFNLDESEAKQIVSLFDELNNFETTEKRKYELRDELMEIFYPLVNYVARYFNNKGEPIDDIRQVGAIGLIKTIDRFRPEKGVKFQSYAVPTISGEIKRYFRDNGWTMKVSRKLQDRGILVSKARNLLTRELHKEPDVKDIAEYLGITVFEVEEAVLASYVYNPISLDVTNPFDDNDYFSLLDYIEIDENPIEDVENKICFAALIEGLSEFEYKILYLRFFKDYTQTKMAEELGISQMHVSRILRKVLSNLRKDFFGFTEEMIDEKDLSHA